MPPSHEQKRRLIKFFHQSIRDHPSWPVLISEGDSWFSYPLKPNIVNVLDSRAGRRLSLLRLERSGDELLSILSGKQKAKLRRQLKRFPVQALLMSGGGNDMVGENLLQFLRERDSPGRDWEDCIIKDRFQRRLTQLEIAYRELIGIRNDVRPGCVIYTHGYDRAIPTGKGVKLGPIRKGPWLRPFLERRKITDPGDQRKVVGWLIDRFNEMLIGLRDRHPGVVHVDCRAALGEVDWHNELHPDREGFKKVAARFAAALNRQFPGVF